MNWLKFSIVVVMVATAAHAKPPASTPLETRSMGTGWPFISLMQHDCDEAEKQAKQIGFICQYVKGNKHLYLYMGKFFEDGSDQAKEVTHRINRVLANFFLAGGREVLFVDMSGPDHKASRLRNCHLRSQSPTCTAWYEPSPLVWKHYGFDRS